MRGLGALLLARGALRGLLEHLVLELRPFEVLAVVSWDLSGAS